MRNLNEQLRGDATSAYHRLQGIEDWLVEADSDVADTLRNRMVTLEKRLNAVVLSGPRTAQRQVELISRIGEDIRTLFLETESQTQDAI